MPLEVHVVTPEREVWTGPAEMRDRARRRGRGRHPRRPRADARPARDRAAPHPPGGRRAARGRRGRRVPARRDRTRASRGSTCWPRRPSSRPRSTWTRRGQRLRASCEAATASSRRPSSRRVKREIAEGAGQAQAGRLRPSRALARVSIDAIMDRLFVTGGARLAGSVRVSGAKNSALKLMAASLLAPGTSVRPQRPADPGLHHDGRDARAPRRAACRSGTASPSWTRPTCASVEAPDELVRQMRASIVVLGPLLARCGRARVSMPGGDEIGVAPDRPARPRASSGWARRSDSSTGSSIAEADELRGAVDHAGLPERRRHREPAVRGGPRARRRP